MTGEVIDFKIAHLSPRVRRTLAVIKHARRSLDVAYRISLGKSALVEMSKHPNSVFAKELKAKLDDFLNQQNA